MAKKQTFELTRDELVSVWVRNVYVVEATTREEAIKKIRDGEVYQKYDETLWETMELLEPDEHNKYTEEIFDGDEVVFTNKID